MGSEVPIVVTLFVCITYSIKSIVDARMRSRLLAVNRPDELIQMILVNEERQRRYSSLRWGITLACLAGGFGIIQAMGWREEFTPGSIAVLLGATGLGNIISYFVTRKLEA